MLFALYISFLKTPLAESWLKIRHKDRRGLLEHLSHDAQACKSTYAFWHERSRNRRCHFIQNPPLILYVFEWQAHGASVIRADGKMVQIHPCHYPARDLFLWPAGLNERLVGGGWNCLLEVFAPLLQHKRVIAVRIRNRPFCWYLNIISKQMQQTRWCRPKSRPTTACLLFLLVVELST